jgi:uncharacterized protein YjbI with pentapeptide repeats
MANEEHLNLLKQGIDVWNDWIEKKLKAEPNFFGGNFIGVDLRDANLYKANFYRACFAAANLEGVNLSEANLCQADFAGANLEGANLSKVNLALGSLAGANLEGANLEEANLTRVILTGVNFSRVILTGVNFSEVDLRRTRFSKINLKGAIFIEANLTEADFSEANLIEANFSEANLTGTNLTGVNLSRANFTGANLKGVNLNGIDLSEATLIGAILSRVTFIGADLRKAHLTGAMLGGADFSRANLRESHFPGAYLMGANFTEASLMGANFTEARLVKAELTKANLTKSLFLAANLTEVNCTEANLTEARLMRVQALAANFENSILTGVCLEDWHINSETNLNGVICEYVYRQYNQQERCPLDRDFAPGEFTKLFQKARDIVNLIFHDGIEWDAFAYAYKKLRIENEDLHLDIKTIDNRDGVLVVTVQGITEVYKTKWEKDFWQRYELALQALEARYQAELKAKDGQFVLYERLISQSERTIAQQEKTIDQKAGAIDQQLGVINQLIERLDNPALHDINIYTSQNSNAITNTTNQSFMSEAYQSKYDQRGANIGSNVDTVRDNARVQSILHNYAPEQRQSLVEVATEIQALLRQLEQSYPTSTPLERQAVVTEVIRRIESNPTLKMRVIGALKKAGTEGIKELVDHPLINIFLAAVEGWQEP